MDEPNILSKICLFYLLLLSILKVYEGFVYQTIPNDTFYQKNSINLITFFFNTRIIIFKTSLI
jgi:hypothetical protein